MYKIWRGETNLHTKRNTYGKVIPRERRKDVIYGSFVCNVWPEKEDQWSNWQSSRASQLFSVESQVLQRLGPEKIISEICIWMVQWIGIVPLGERLLVRSGPSWFPLAYHFIKSQEMIETTGSTNWLQRLSSKEKNLPIVTNKPNVNYQKVTKITNCDNKIQNQRRKKKFEYRSRLMVANSFAAGEATEEKSCSTRRNFEDPVVSSWGISLLQRRNMMLQHGMTQWCCSKSIHLI